MGTNFLLAGGLLLALGILLSVYYRRLRAERSGWPTCSGTIDTAQITKESVSSGKGVRRYFDRLTLRYSYVVGDTVYRGEGRSDTQARHASLLTRYAVGRPIVIAHHPTKVGTSEVADTDVTTPGLVTTVLTLAMTALAIGVIAAGLGVYAMFHDGR